jgi:hypothetical protein
MLATSMVAGTPLLARQLQLPLRFLETRLVDADITGVAAIPLNLFQDIANIPANEVGALNLFGTSLIDGGTWWVASATNLWGEDPGDPGRFMALTDMAIPFTAISGQGMPEPGAPGWTDADWNSAANGTLPLGQQLTLLLDAELPTSASSDATWSGPLDPVTPITGFTQLDRDIWSAAIFSNQQQFPLINNWYQVPLSELTSGHFNFGTVVDPSSGVGPNGSVPSDSVFGFAGTHPLIDPSTGMQEVNANGNPINLMPWSNQSFTFNPMSPFENFNTSLQAPVDPNTYLSGFQFPSLTDFMHALQSLAAGSVISFDPFVDGSPFCSAPGCGLPPSMQMPGIVEAINNMDPGNTATQHWVDLFNTPSTGPGGLDNPYGMTNDPTQEQINFADLTNASGQQMFDFGNPSPSDPAPPGVETPINFPVSPTMQELINFMQTSGIQAFVHQMADAQGFTPIDWSNPDVLLSPAASAAAVQSGAFDPSQLAANLAQLLGSQLTAGLSQLLASELPQLLGSQLSADLLSVF